MKIGAVVLCGGKSRRMGESKAWLPFGSERMLQRVVRILSASVDSIVVVAARGQELPELPTSVTVVHDTVESRGPLEGLAAGLASIPHDIDLVYATATDVPFLRPAWISRLVELIGDHDLAIPFADGFHHPLASLYRKSSVLPAIETLLKDDRLRPVFLIKAVRTRVIKVDELEEVDPGLRTLQNLNTPEDYRDALEEFSREVGG